MDGPLLPNGSSTSNDEFLKFEFDTVVDELLQYKPAGGGEEDFDKHRQVFAKCMSGILAAREERVRAKEADKYRVELFKKNEEVSVLKATQRVKEEMRVQMEEVMRQHKVDLREMQRRQDERQERFNTEAREIYREAKEQQGNLLLKLFEQQQQQQQVVTSLLAGQSPPLRKKSESEEHPQSYFSFQESIGRVESPPQQSLLTEPLFEVDNIDDFMENFTENEKKVDLGSGSNTKNDMILEHVSDDDIHYPSLVSLSDKGNGNADLDLVSIPDAEENADLDLVSLSDANDSGFIEDDVKKETLLHEKKDNIPSTLNDELEMREIAEIIYELRTNDAAKNLTWVQLVMEKYPSNFSDLLLLCPKIDALISHMLVMRLGVRIKTVSWTSDTKDWSDEDCKRIGRSFGTLLRGVQTAEAAIEAWRLHYPQMSTLFEVKGYEEFMTVIARNLLRDNNYGMIFRVSVGALLSSLDYCTDIYVLSTYSESPELAGQANLLLGMILLNISVQVVTVLGQYRKKNWMVKLREVCITLSLLRPIVDAYRLSTNHNDEEVLFDALAETMINKCSELACESIPGCVLQLYVWVVFPDQAGEYALFSIAVSILTTGLAAGVISFDMDVEITRRKSQPKFYGYIPDDNGLRGRCFILMTLISALHNFSKCFGCAILAASGGGMMVMYTVGGEFLIFSIYKSIRRDFMYWPRLTGILGFLFSIFARLVIKLTADFSGCFQARHPYELGGFAFTLSVIWAQIFPFIALHVVETSTTAGEDNAIANMQNISIFLSASFGVWLFLNLLFFCTIDSKYFVTFFGWKTAAQYTCERFIEATDDKSKFSAAFDNRMSYKKAIKEEVKDWVANNIDSWEAEKPDWFVVSKIPDDFLPMEVFAAEGGFKRKRSNFSIKEVNSLVATQSSGLRKYSLSELNATAGGADSVVKSDEVLSQKDAAKIADWKRLAEDIYHSRCNNFKVNFVHVRQTFNENEDLVAPLTELCPRFREIISYILEDRFGFRVSRVDYRLDMKNWGDLECMRVGSSFATLLRNRKTGEVALDAWRLHYVQLNTLFLRVVGFREFMVVIANNTLRDSIYGMIYRVTVGATLSMVDAATDIYVISTYFQSDELILQARILLGMIITNAFCQVLFVMGKYNKAKNWKKIAYEIMITCVFLRPAVDAYRVSTNYVDNDATIDVLTEMMANKSSELATESIPACVLQLYVWLLRPAEAGKYALLSIGVSALTTGFNAAMIAFDCDVDSIRRRSQPKFYGYIPDDHNLRTRCLFLMTTINTLHNLSRSLGEALLAYHSFIWVLYFLIGEIMTVISIKCVRGDFYYWPRVEAPLFASVLGCVSRTVTVLVVSFSGCLHFRHPFELGGVMFMLCMLWAQIFPFIALHIVETSTTAGEDNAIANMQNISIFLSASFGVWLFLNLLFFCTIDSKYFVTFFGWKTAAQYTCERFIEATDDKSKFSAAFDNRMSYKKAIKEEVKDWVANNIDSWEAEKPDWFVVSKIPDDFLPMEVFAAEGGFKRKRSNFSIKEIPGRIHSIIANNNRVHPAADME